MRPIPLDHNVQYHLANILAPHLAAANMLGRLDVLASAKRKTGRTLPLALSSRIRTFAESDVPGDPLHIGIGFNLPNDDAANYIRNLTPVTRETFDALSAQYRKMAFTLSGTADVRLIGKVRDELAEVVQQGGTSADFKNAIDSMTTDAGVEELNAFSLDTAFQTATLKANALGRYEQLTDPATVAVLPFWTYMTVGDQRVRPEHALLDGFTARADDPIWNLIYPPNGFNCRCSVIAKLASEVGDDANDPGNIRLAHMDFAKLTTESFGKVF